MVSFFFKKRILYHKAPQSYKLVLSHHSENVLVLTQGLGPFFEGFGRLLFVWGFSE